MTMSLTSTLQEFIFKYRVLLKDGLLSSLADIALFLDKTFEDVVNDEYQIGCSKVKMMMLATGYMMIMMMMTTMIILMMMVMR